MNSILETETQTEAQIKANDINRRFCAEKEKFYEKENKHSNLTVVHEFGHLYGAPDHYDAYVDPPSSNDLCIYGDYRDNCLSSLTMCTACQASIRSNLSRYD